MIIDINPNYKSYRGKLVKMLQKLSLAKMASIQQQQKEALFSFLRMMSWCALQPSTSTAWRSLWVTGKPQTRREHLCRILCKVWRVKGG